MVNVGILVLSIVLCGLLQTEQIGTVSVLSEEWDHLMFVQQWPRSTCELSKEHQCNIPSFVDSWTIHGIWPSQGKTRGPNYCDPTWKFDESKVQDLEEFLVKQWPNLYDDTPKTEFWKHEWEKHGTCAASLAALDNEHKYFTVGLVLNRHLELLSALNKSSIMPSSQPYQASDITNALRDHYNVNVCAECKYTRETGQLLTQVVICLNKNLKIMDCPVCEEACWDDEDVLYLPIKHS